MVGLARIELWFLFSSTDLRNTFRRHLSGLVLYVFVWMDEQK